MTGPKSIFIPKNKKCLFFQRKILKFKHYEIKKRKEERSRAHASLNFEEELFSFFVKKKN